jgi:hypothetical protein
MNVGERIEVGLVFDVYVRLPVPELIEGVLAIDAKGRALCDRKSKPAAPSAIAV